MYVCMYLVRPCKRLHYKPHSVVQQRGAVISREGVCSGPVCVCMCMYLVLCRRLLYEPHSTMIVQQRGAVMSREGVFSGPVYVCVYVCMYVFSSPMQTLTLRATQYYDSAAGGRCDLTRGGIFCSCAERMYVCMCVCACVMRITNRPDTYDLQTVYS